jgi:lipopolysaccharide biosynthesis glycosyltransferase
VASSCPISFHGRANDEKMKQSTQETRSDERIIIACASDAAYVMPVATMLRSLAANLADDQRVEVFILDDNVKQQDKDKIAACLSEAITVQWQAPPPLPAGLPLWGRMSRTTYHKLTLDAWLPSSCKQVIWLDSDLLILTDTSRLWATSPAPKIVLAAQDERIPFCASKFGIKAYREVGMAVECKYFNAGVMVIDLERWRAAEIGARSLEYLARYAPDVYFFDQEALNVALRCSWGELDQRWNRHPELSNLCTTSGIRTTTDPWIVHFSGNRKPWVSHGSGRYHQLYYHYLDQTAWSGHRPTSTWRSRSMERYATSTLRRWLYPAEEWATWFLSCATRHIAEPH